MRKFLTLLVSRSRSAIITDLDLPLACRRLIIHSCLIALCSLLNAPVTAIAQEYQTDSYTKLLLHGNGTDGAISHPITNPENYDSYTKLMLHMDGSDGSTTFTDAATSKSVTANGNAQIDVAQSKFGGASGLFDGNGDYLSVPDNNDWYFGSGDFSIDFWVSFATDPSGQYIVFCSQQYDANNYWMVSYSTGYKLQIYCMSGGVIKAAYDITSGIAFSVNTWYHLAFERVGTSAKIFINGVSQTLTESTAFGTNDIGDMNSVLWIGSGKDGAYYVNGWLEEFRICKGIARWTSNFTPPTAPYGKVALTTSQSKFGGSSARLDGCGSYLSIADNNDWYFGIGDFTIDFWIKFNDYTTEQVFCGQTGQFWKIQKRSHTFGDKLHMFFQYNSVIIASYEMTNAWSGCTNDTWYHLAFERVGSSAKIFIDGISQNLTETTPFGAKDVGNTAEPLQIGTVTIWPAPVNGCIDEFRFSKSNVRWTSNFTPPTSPCSTDNKATLLLHFDGANGDTTTNDVVGGDESDKNKIVTYYGNVQLDTAQSKLSGSSMLFDGSGDYLSVPDNDDWYFGSGDFTIDFWVRFIVNNPTSMCFFSQFVDNSNYSLFELDGSGNINWHSKSGGSNTLYFYTTSSNSFIKNTWYHVAVVINGGNPHIYINGSTQPLTIISTGIVPDLASSLYHGQEGNSLFYFNGWIDEFRVSKGIARQFGAISGVKFNDIDGDGVKDVGEPGLPNWKIFLAGDKIDSILTDSTGSYRFPYLPAGTYSIYEKKQNGWLKTKPSPDSGYTVILPINTDTTGFNFGNFKLGSIFGQKFNDLDANGAKNGGDTGLTNWLIRLKMNDVQIDSVLTGTGGNYSFTNLGPGNYILSEQPQSNWDQTYPLSPGTYNFQLLSGDSLTDKNFGNYWAIDNSITLRCFRDKDGNFNTRDDLVSKRWNLRLYSGSISGGTLVKDTSASSFTLLNVTPGTYIAVEADSSGWDHIGKLRDTIAFEGSYNKDTITISADESHVITFANFHPNTVTIKKFKDDDGDFSTTGERSAKKWSLTLCTGKSIPGTTVTSVGSAESLRVENLGEGEYTALEADSLGWTHIGTSLNGNSTQTSLTFVHFAIGEGEAHRIDFVNSRLGTITVTKFLDQDGDFRTGEGSLKSWALKLYRIEGTDTTIVDSVNSYSTLTKTNLPEGTYMAVEADSGYPWSHIATELSTGGVLEERPGGTQNKITFTLSGGQSRHARFINFNHNRIKIWTAVEDCDWSNGYNWDPPGIPIPGDSIVVPDTALCPLVIPAGSSVGTIIVAAQETVYISPGNFVSTGDVTVNGTMIANAADTSLITIGGDWTVNSFSAGQSKVVFTGLTSQIIEGNDISFFKLKIADGATIEIQTDGNFSVQNNLYLGGNINAAGDTIFILNPSITSVGGSGRITKGTLQRAIEQGITSSYRFESPQSYVQFNGTGTYPTEVVMTVIPDTTPSDYGDTWEVVPSVVDTVSNIISADTVKKFSKWRMGVPRAQSIDPLVRRRYTIYAKGGEGFSARVVLRYNQSEVPIGTAEDSLVLLRSLQSSVGMSWHISAGWNIISLPVEVEDARKTVLFPNAVSEAFYYDGTYYEEDTLKKGISYWLKFDSSQTIQFSGIPTQSENIIVKGGWNMIGSISDTILTSSIESDPPGIITSDFFEYSGSYKIADTIYPGRGYWVKVSQAGELIMSSTGFKNRAGLIRIIPTSELPPPPPIENTSTAKALPNEYALEQAYPNPFNPITVIRYQLPLDSRIILKIYNILAEEVKVLVDEVQSAGYKVIEWNVPQIGLSSGIYFYRLDAVSISDPGKAFTQVKKVILIK